MLFFELSEEATREKMALLGFVGVFFLTWSLYAFFILPIIKEQHAVLYTFNVFKLLIWILPVFVYLHREKVDALVYLKLKGPVNRAVLWTIVVSLALSGYQLAGQFFVSHEIHFNPLLDLHTWISGVLFVGLTEEILFRGFLLQKMARHMQFGYANMITAGLFLLSHFPGYLALNHMPPDIFMKTVTFSFIFLFGMMMGYVLKKTNSLWSCIVIHSIVDFVSFSLQG